MASGNHIVDLGELLWERMEAEEQYGICEDCGCEVCRCDDMVDDPEMWGEE